MIYSYMYYKQCGEEIMGYKINFVNKKVMRKKEKKMVKKSNFVIGFMLIILLAVRF